MLTRHFEGHRDQVLQWGDKECLFAYSGRALEKDTNWDNQAVEDREMQLAFLLVAVDSRNMEEAFHTAHLVVGGKVVGLNWELVGTERHLEVRMEDMVSLLRVVGRKVADHLY